MISPFPPERAEREKRDIFAGPSGGNGRIPGPALLATSITVFFRKGKRKIVPERRGFRLTHIRRDVNILYYNSAENGKVASHPKDREGPSPAERGPAAGGCEVRPGARRVMPPGLAPIAASRVKLRVEPRDHRLLCLRAWEVFCFHPRGYNMFKALNETLEAYQRRDPAARSKL